MPSKLTIKDSSDEPTPTEYGGKIERLSDKATGRASGLVIEEADQHKKKPVVKGGRISIFEMPPRKVNRRLDDDRNNPLHVRQWVYDFIVGAAAAVLLLSFLVIVIASALQGKLDYTSFLGGLGMFLGGLGVGYKANRGSKRRPPFDDDDRESDEQEDDAGINSG